MAWSDDSTVKRLCFNERGIYLRWGSTTD